MNPYAAAGQVALSTATTLIKANQAKKQIKKGRELEEGLVRPDYEVPDSITDNYALAKMLSDQGITSEQKNDFLENTLTSTANNIRNFRSRKAGVIGSEIVGKQTQESIRELRRADAEARLSNIRDYMKQGQILANYEDKEFQLDEMDPYSDNMNYARSLQAAGTTNMNRAIDSFTQSLNSAGAGYYQGLSQ